jgi:putative endonuclease
MPNQFYVYILSSASRILYVGVTNNLTIRLWRHRNGQGSSFTLRYRIDRLVYYEPTGNPIAAVAREKQIKAWRREKKIRLIESLNPEWRDLAIDWQLDTVASRP